MQTCADGVGARERLEMVERRTGGHERAWIMDVCKRNGCNGKGWKWVEGTDARTCADGAGARERLEMGWEKGRWA